MFFVVMLFIIKWFDLKCLPMELGWFVSQFVVYSVAINNVRNKYYYIITVLI